MASDDEDEPDLMLVFTYFPVIIATFKACALVVLGEGLRHVRVSVSVRGIVYVLLCYIDVNRQRRERFERACGYTIICAIAVTLRDMQEIGVCDGLTKTTEMVLDSAWAVASSTWGTLACMGLLAVSINGLVVCVAAMLVVHVCLACTVMTMVELLMRVIFYMSMCAVMFFAKRQLRTVDRNAYMRSIPFVCSHVLVVGVYVAVPSLAVCMSLFAWSTYRLDVVHRHERTVFDTRVDIQPKSIEVDCSGERPLSEEHRLVLQLRRAMEAQ